MVTVTDIINLYNKGGTTGNGAGEGTGTVAHVRALVNRKRNGSYGPVHRVQVRVSI